jgi:hypothetical protein
MARELPAVLHGSKTVANGRDPATGRFLPGNAGGGRPANPFARRQAEIRGVLLAAVTPADVRAILRQVIRLAKRGSLPATELLLRWTMGGPPPAIDPDKLEAHELEVRRSRPTLVDWLTLADEQADREPAAVDPPAEDPDEAPALAGEAPPRDAGVPQLRAMLAWALQELAEAERRAVPPAPPDPMAGWETFAATRLAWEPAAAVPIDLLFVSYARWAAACGAVGLAEDRVLAWLREHGASVRTGAVSQVMTVAGVRVAME